MGEVVHVKFYDRWRFYFWSFYIALTVLVLSSWASGDVVPLPGVIGILLMFWLHARLKEPPTLMYRRIYTKLLDLTAYFLIFKFLGCESALLFAVFYMLCEIKGYSTPFKRLFDLELYNGKTGNRPLNWLYVVLRNAFLWAIPFNLVLKKYAEIGTPGFNGYDVIACVVTLLSIILLLFNNTDAAEAIPPARVRQRL